MSAKEPTRNPQQFPTIEPFLLLSPFSPRWFSLHRGFFCPQRVDSSSQWENPARWQLTQSPETATHWNNPPRWQAAQRPNPSSDWEDAPLERYIGGMSEIREHETSDSHDSSNPNTPTGLIGRDRRWFQGGSASRCRSRTYSIRAGAAMRLHDAAVPLPARLGLQ